MTDEPAHEEGSDTSPPKPAPESLAARSLTDRSKPEGSHPAEPAVHPEPRGGPRLWPRVVGVLILLIGVGGAWVWQNPGFVESSMRSIFPGSGAHDGDLTPVKALEARVARLEQQSPPAALTARLDALEKRVSAMGQSSGQLGGQPPVADLRPLLARLDALEARPMGAPSPGAAAPNAAPSTLIPVGPDIRPLLARLDALEKQVTEHTVNPAKVDAITAQMDALAAHDRTAEAAADVRGKLDDLEHRLSELTASQTKLAGTSDRTARLAQMEIALRSGHPLGPTPDAPPALSRFATTNPPTEAGLRLSFTAAAQQALKVSQPDTEGKPFLDRVLARLQDFRLITVREGDQVVIGNATAATLARAKAMLDAGDLNEAVRVVATLSGPPAEKIAPWLADAKALQAAREALASLAERS